MNAAKTIPCTCGGGGHLVEITYANDKPGATPTPCCSCTVAKYRVRYGEPTFKVTPVKKP